MVLMGSACQTGFNSTSPGGGHAGDVSEAEPRFSHWELWIKRRETEGSSSPRWLRIFMACCWTADVTRAGETGQRQDREGGVAPVCTVMVMVVTGWPGGFRSLSASAPVERWC